MSMTRTETSAPTAVGCSPTRTLISMGSLSSLMFEIKSHTESGPPVTVVVQSVQDLTSGEFETVDQFGRQLHARTTMPFKDCHRSLKLFMKNPVYPSHQHRFQVPDFLDPATAEIPVRSRPCHRTAPVQSPSSSLL